MSWIALIVGWCIENDYGDWLFWAIALAYVGFFIHLFEDIKP